MEPDVTSTSYDMGKYLLDDKLSIGFSGFAIKEGGKKRYLRWSSGNSTILAFNKTEDAHVVRDFSFDLIRPNPSETEPVVVYVSHNNRTNKYVIKKEKKIRLRFIFTPGINYIKFESKSPPFDNGDPRNIVFGIANYRFNNI